MGGKREASWESSCSLWLHHTARTKSAASGNFCGSITKPSTQIIPLRPYGSNPSLTSLQVPPASQHLGRAGHKKGSVQEQKHCTRDDFMPAGCQPDLLVQQEREGGWPGGLAP